MLIVTGLDDILEKFDRLSNLSTVEEIATHAVDAAQPMNEASMRAALASVEHGPYATGSVSGSVVSTAATINAYGVFAVAKPSGRDAKGERNAKKAALLEYGAPRLPQRCWRDKAVAMAKGPCIETMEKVIQSEMELE